MVVLLTPHVVEGEVGGLKRRLGCQWKEDTQIPLTGRWSLGSILPVQPYQIYRRETVTLRCVSKTELPVDVPCTVGLLPTRLSCLLGNFQ